MDKGYIEVKVPEKCCNCRMGFVNEYYNQFECYFKPGEEIKPDDGKPDWCPIKPLPEREYHLHCDNVLMMESGTELLERNAAKAPSVAINNEAVKIGAITFGKGTKAYRCPNCKRLVIYRDRFCRDCGQRLKWEE